MPRGLKSGRLLPNLFYCRFVAFQKDMSLQKANFWLFFSTTAEGGTATQDVPGREWVSAQPPQPRPSLAGVTTLLNIPRRSTAAPCHLDCAWQMGAHAFVTSGGGCFLTRPGGNLHWKGAPYCNLVKKSYLTHVLLLFQQGPGFSWDFKRPRNTD